jgi:selenocysteine-specific elongation factor
VAPAQRDLPPLTLGTAGHIDHGKSMLVGALTGHDTDRLPEEHRRGISIELGYAPLELPSGRRLSVVDAPGHERFVRTMVAGATGVDLFLLCVAADDGVMPQTREHVAVLRHLGVTEGVIAITKADTAEAALAAEEAADLAPGVDAVPVSAVEHTGLDELLAALDRVAARLPGRASKPTGGARLHIDRSFTLRGIGTVVTGTLWSGRISRGDGVAILPRELEARVRSIQVHDRPVEAADAGQRVALALSGVGWRELGRGDVVVPSGSRASPTYLVDCHAALDDGAEPLGRGARVHVHHGTRDSPARVVPLEGEVLRPSASAFVQLRLEAPLIAERGDRFVLRRIAPPDTIGGGEVVHPAPRKHGPDAEVVRWLRAVERGEEVADPRERSRARRAGAGGVGPATADDTVPSLDDTALRLAALLRSDGREPRTDADLAAAAGVSSREAGDRLRRLEHAGQAVRAGPNLHFHPEPLAELEARIVAICERDGEATIGGVRDELGTSRKYAQALLEHLDASKVTRRRGDAHVLRRR